MNLIKPSRLKPGDKVATISLSWGGAGDDDILWRYNLGKKRLQEEFGLEVIEMPHTLKGTDFLYNHPEKRAEDLMLAFKDESIKAIFSCIGGDESVRMIPLFSLKLRKISQNQVMWNTGYAIMALKGFYKGLIFAKPYDNLYYDEYKEVILKVVRDELGLVDLPILYNMNFGHTAPMITIPYGAMAEIDSSKKTFSILDTAVI